MSLNKVQTMDKVVPNRSLTTQVNPVRNLAVQYRNKRLLMRAVSCSNVSASSQVEFNQHVREGHFEEDMVHHQSQKVDNGQPSIHKYLPTYKATEKVEGVAVVGCGPAGLALAANLAKEGQQTVLVGPDCPFVNNYGVWLDEFDQLGLGDTIETRLPHTMVYYGDDKKKDLKRTYGRVSRHLLRHRLLSDCQEAGVMYCEGMLDDVQANEDDQQATIKLEGGKKIQMKLVVLASGQAAGRFLRYESDAPSVASQTAYGIEADVEGFFDAYPPDTMVFMDYRRHHTGLWQSTATSYKPGCHPNGDQLLASRGEVPSFLYAMPLGGNKVFLEETCLVTKPAMPFQVLKRRLMRRMEALGIKVTKVHEEEWSYIPVGGPLPVSSQCVTAFGAAANLVHPATGYSITRSLQEAPVLAKEIAQQVHADAAVGEVSSYVWDSLWPMDKRRQASFHVFGMELFTQMELELLSTFFATFFDLPSHYWKGFLASSLSSVSLLQFALTMFMVAPINIKIKLMQHLIFDSSGQYMLQYYIKEPKERLNKLIADMKQSA